jgi:hypothetical protein
MRRARQHAPVSCGRAVGCWACGRWAGLRRRAGAAGRACAPWAAPPHRPVVKVANRLAVAHRSRAPGAAIGARRMGLARRLAPRPRARPSWASPARRPRRRDQSADASGAARQAATRVAMAPRGPRVLKDWTDWKDSRGWKAPKGRARWAARRCRWQAALERQAARMGQMGQMARMGRQSRARPMASRRWGRPAGGTRSLARGRTRPVYAAWDRRRARAGGSFVAGRRACAAWAGPPRRVGSPGLGSE